MIKIYKLTFTPLQFLSAGFILIILIGGMLLAHPAASRDGQSIPFVDAVFTSASATCVTGLVIYDTYTQFTAFGQAVILCLIQIGGLGFVTIGIFFSMAIGKRIGLRERSIMKESISALKLGGIVRLVRRAVFGTLIIELIGALILALRLVPRFGLASGLWSSLFHSVSAFCNAGFDLMGKLKPLSSLGEFSGDIVINFVIAALIIVGGIGFIVWDDIIDNKWHIRRCRLQTKIVLSVTAMLIAAGTVGFYLLERNHAFAGMGGGEKMLAALFQSVTPRTAGFCTVDMAKLSDGGSILTMILMVIGASPGSTGGGIKTTTFFVMVFSVIAFLRSRDDINVFKRRVEQHAVYRAFNSAALYLFAAVIGTFVISLQGIGIEATLFEALSAVGTVGLSQGVTAGLNTLSKLAIIMLMYVGRLGSLSVLMAVTERRIKTKINNVEEKIIIG